MPTVPEDLTPRQRLALSRQAMVRELNGEPPLDETIQDTDGARMSVGAGPEGTAAKLGRPAPRGFPWGSVARNVAQRWWQRHPANAVGQLARPLLQQYAHREPVKLMAVAAATGAVLVVLRPWRLLSATAMVALLFKNSDVADVIDQLMHKTYSSNDVHP